MNYLHLYMPYVLCLFLEHLWLGLASPVFNGFALVWSLCAKSCFSSPFHLFFKLIHTGKVQIGFFLLFIDKLVGFVSIYLWNKLISVEVFHVNMTVITTFFKELGYVGVLFHGMKLQRYAWNDLSKPLCWWTILPRRRGMSFLLSSWCFYLLPLVLVICNPLIFW